jgi:hypothetical protein
MMQTLSIALLVAALVSMSSAAAADDSSTFKITTKRVNDTVEARADKAKATFTVKSPSGISQMVIERTDDKWPDAVVLRLRFNGLEFFQVTNSKVTLNVSVSTQNGKARLWKDGQENTLLDAKSPYWMHVRMIGGDGKPSQAIPLKDGYFEMKLPKAFFEGNPKALTVDWIDFYRN